MRDLGSAADQHRAVSEAYGDIGAAADPWRAVANGLGGKGVCRRVVGLGRPDPEVGQDLLDDFGVLDEGDDPHWSRIPGTDGRVRFVDLLDQPCPRTLRG